MQTTRKDHSLTERERRRCSRFLIEGEPTVTAGIAGRSYRCALVDISTGGARLRFDGDTPVSAVVALNHPGVGRLSGDCVWRSSSQMGVRFHQAGLPQSGIAAHGCP